MIGCFRLCGREIGGLEKRYSIYLLDCRLAILEV